MLNEYHAKRKDYLKQLAITYPDCSIKVEEKFDKFSAKNAVVWIDPLDGTSDFITGNLSAVTVLIGLSIDGVSKIGIVHNPFSEQDMTKGQTSFATCEHGLFQLDFNETMP